MSLAFEVRRQSRLGLHPAPPLPAGERHGHDWGVIYLRGPAGQVRVGLERVEGVELGAAAIVPTISWANGVIHVSNRRLIDAENPGACQAFLRGAFRLGEVRSVEVDWAEGMASVSFEPSQAEAMEVLRRLAAATRGQAYSDEDVDLEPTTPRPGTSCRVRWFRHGNRLSTWEVASETIGRIRFRHPRLGGDRQLSHRLEAELGAVHGVSHVHARPLTGSLLVQFEPAVLSKPQLLHILDEFVQERVAPPPAEIQPPAVAFGLANGSVGLAAVGELAVPALLPASAALLVVSNLRVIREAGRELRRGQIGLPVLYTTIIAGTLGTGQFLGTALMSWMYKFWRHRHRLDQARIRRRLLPALTQRGRFIRLLVGGQAVEMPADRLRVGDRIVVEPGEMVPADGRLLNGPVVVDERLVSGVAGLTRKRPGDAILAGSSPVQGTLELEVLAHGRDTRAARLGRELAAAAVPMPTELSVTRHGEAYACRAVPPTLAAAGIGLIVGDLVTASAILRPDYATGPGLGVSAEFLRDVADSARDGIVIRDPSAFDRLATADVWVVDHHPALERVGLEVERVCPAGLVPDEVGILQLAATACRDLADPRAIALHAACASCGVAPLGIEPDYRGPGIMIRAGTARVTVDDAGELDPDPTSPIVLSTDGREIGRITFQPSTRPLAFESLRRLQAAGAAAIGLLSDRPDEEAGALAATLGLDFHRGGLTPAAKADLIRSYRDRGVKVAYIGDGRRAPEAARAAHVAVSIAEEIDPERDPAPILALQPDLCGIASLRLRASAHVDRVRMVHRAVLIPNLFCVAGAFFLGFTSLSAVVITNLGTWAVYAGLPPRIRRENRKSAPQLQ
jgi:cation transport ATPase